MVCGFWSIFSWKHVFFGGFWRFLESPKKKSRLLMSSSSKMKLVFGKAQLLDLCGWRPEKKMIHPQKSTNVPWKRTTYSCKKWKDCLPNHPSWGAMWVFGPWGEYHVKTHSRFLNKNHVKVTPPIFWRVILNWCLLSLLFLLEVCLFWLLEALSFADFRGVRESFDSQPWSVIVRSRNQESDQRSSQLAWNYPSGTKSIGRWQVW